MGNKLDCLGIAHQHHLMTSSPLGIRTPVAVPCRKASLKGAGADSRSTDIPHCWERAGNNNTQLDLGVWAYWFLMWTKRIVCTPPKKKKKSISCVTVKLSNSVLNAHLHEGCMIKPTKSKAWCFCEFNGSAVLAGTRPCQTSPAGRGTLNAALPSLCPRS